MTTNRLLGALVIVAAIAASACSAPQLKKNRADELLLPTVEEHLNAQAVRRLFMECMNEGRVGWLPGVVSPAYKDDRGRTGVEAFAQPMAKLRRAFPDSHYRIEELIARGDRVAVRWTWSGTKDDGSATHATLQGMAMYELRDAMIVRSWVQAGAPALQDQIGSVAAVESR